MPATTSQGPYTIEQVENTGDLLIMAPGLPDDIATLHYAGKEFEPTQRANAELFRSSWEVRSAALRLLTWFKHREEVTGPLSADEWLKTGCPNALAADIDKLRAALAEPQP